MRERTSWIREDIQQRLAATSRRAEDPRAMNQDHLQRQPPADKYLTGDPSTFAEDVHPSEQNWKSEYQDGDTARNEIGMPEMRGDTFNHPETDPGSSPSRGGGGRQAALDEETLVKKADQCVRVARVMLGAKATEAAVEDQALALMNLSDGDLIATVNRLAAQEEDEDDKKQSQGQQDQKQAAQQDQDDKKQSQGQQDQKQDKEAAAKTAWDQMMAQSCQMAIDAAKTGNQQQMAQAVQQMMQYGQQQQMSQDQIQQKIQQMIQQAVQQGQPTQGQQQQVNQVQQTQMEQQALDDMVQGQDDVQMQQGDQIIDQMLSQDMPPQVQQQQANEFGIQLDSPAMDIGEVGMGPEDEVLSTLFANNTEVQNAQQAHVLQHGVPAPMQVQASQPMTRTASTRLGTKPSGGVSQIGGLGAPAPTQTGDVEKLSSLWNSAPDVSDVFRT